MEGSSLLLRGGGTTRRRLAVGLGPPTHARLPCRFFFLIWRRLFSPMMDGGETGQAWEEASLKRPGSCFLRDSLFFKMTPSDHPGTAEDAQAMEEESLRSFALLKVTECCRSARGWGGDSTTPAPCPQASCLGAS